MFANKDIDAPLPVLGAIQMDQYYKVVVHKLTAFYTQAMTKQRFDEWIEMHKGRMVNLGIVLYFYKGTLNEDHYKNSYMRPNVMINIVQSNDSYPYSFSNSKIELEDESEQYFKNIEVITDILEEYDVLFPTAIYADGWLEDVEYFKNNNNVNINPIKDELVIYDDTLVKNIDNVYICDGATYKLDSPNALSGDNSIELKTQGNYIQFKPEFWDHPIDVSDYDFLEFSIRTSSYDYAMAITGEHDQTYDSSYTPIILGSSIMDYNRPYSWLGIQSGDPQGWHMIQIPISTIEKDQDGKIYGISFEFYSNFGTVYLDNIKLVSR